MNFAVSAKQNEKMDKYLDFARELNPWIMSDGDTNCSQSAWNGSQKPSRKA